MSEALNQAFTTPSKVNASEFEMVRSYFLSISPTQEISDAFTALVFRISARSGKSVFDLLEQFKTGTTDQIMLTEEIAFYLNSLSTSKTSMFGVSEPLPPVASVNRNIIQ